MNFSLNKKAPKLLLLFFLFLASTTASLLKLLLALILCSGQEKRVLYALYPVKNNEFHALGRKKKEKHTTMKEGLLRKMRQRFVTLIAAKKKHEKL